MMRMRHVAALVAAAAGLAFSPVVVQAITAYEFLGSGDLLDEVDLLGSIQVRDILGDGTEPDVDTNPSGLGDFAEIRELIEYTHSMTWLVPPADTFLDATLVLFTAGLGNDQVSVDNVYLGNIGTLGVGLGIFAGSAGETISVALSDDGELNVVIDKQGRFGGTMLLASKLIVEYEPVASVADGGETLALLGLTLLGCRALRRKTA